MRKSRKEKKWCSVVFESRNSSQRVMMWWWPEHSWWLKHLVGCFSCCCFNFYLSGFSPFLFLKMEMNISFPLPKVGYVICHSHSRWAEPFLFPLPKFKSHSRSPLGHTIAASAAFTNQTVSRWASISSIFFMAFKLFRMNWKLESSITRKQSHQKTRKWAWSQRRPYASVAIVTPSFRILPLAGQVFLSIKRPDGAAEHKGWQTTTPVSSMRTQWFSLIISSNWINLNWILKWWWPWFSFMISFN